MNSTLPTGAPGSTPPGAPAGAPGSLPYLSAQQSGALLRSATAIAGELMAGSFTDLMDFVRDKLAVRWDFDVGSPIVQRLLATKAERLRSAFLEHLARRQNAALERLATQRNAPAAALELDAAELELVVETEVGGDALGRRAARRMGGLVEQPMRDLELILAYLCGREQISGSDNPFGPDTVVPALLQAAIDADLHAEAWGFFLSAVEPEIAAEIGRVAQALLDHFRAHGLEVRAIRRALSARRTPPAPRPVPPAEGGGPPLSWFTPTPAPAGAAAPRAAGQAAPGSATDAQVRQREQARVRQGAPVIHGAGSNLSAMAPAAAGAAAGAVPSSEQAASAAASVAQARGEAGVVLRELLGRLQTNVGEGVLPPLAQGQQGPVGPQLLEALGELQSLGLEGLHGALFAGTPAGSINAWREHLISQSTRTIDKLTIEIVGMMFDHVLRDSQVPPEIKALLSRLQFPVLKAALLDAAFFASSAHPARRLIDRIAAAAVGWEPYGDENERFRAEVERVVDVIMQRFERDVALFETVLAEFEAFLGDIAPRDADPISRAKRALEEAEKREVLTINTTIQVRRAFERVELESWLREFLVGPWVQVLVQASLRDDQTKGFSRSFREVIHEMVWSVQPKASAEERRRLVELIPVLTRVIRDGLSLIRHSPRDQEEFLQQLMAAHAFAVKPTDQASYIRRSLQSSEIRASIEGMQLTASFPLTAIPGGVRVPARAVLQAAADHDVDLCVPEALTDVGLSDRGAESRMDHALAQWTRGSWFELREGETFIKARLRWISPLRTMFMFSSGAHNRAHVMSPELIHSYLRRGYIRALESAPLTERAAHGVVADFAADPQRATELTGRVAVAG